MSVMRTHAPEVSGSRPPRVREQAREVLLLMAFSAAVSVGCALLLVLTHLASGSGR
ncbi:hypothetical protein L615_006800000060 [Nocardioides sp. J9]|uniref:hypothetical protein n=1 Tax=unclassified Nocardioides TaxID=2615069 RepID=UPI0004B0618E|nr:MULTISPECIES: hypothetical protein [unclassified Nocardioides]TWG92887.1 hypothetical protein L615_006800000060 [Nocardioides sp. J9]